MANNKKYDSRFAQSQQMVSGYGQKKDKNNDRRFAESQKIVSGYDQKYKDMLNVLANGGSLTGQDFMNAAISTYKPPKTASGSPIKTSPDALLQQAYNKASTQTDWFRENEQKSSALKGVDAKLEKNKKQSEAKKAARTAVQQYTGVTKYPQAERIIAKYKRMGLDGLTEDERIEVQNAQMTAENDLAGHAGNISCASAIWAM